MASGKNRPARILVIAGSDSSGGAGIQADIKTATALGAYAMTAVTAVTAQDTMAVRAIYPVPPGIVREQIVAALSDIGADAIKTGMLGSASVAETVAGALAESARGIPLVVDPVMAASSGAMLLEDGAIEILKTRLVPLAALVTPNQPEAEKLTGVWPDKPDAVMRAAEKLFSLGAKAVLFKGGHGAGPEVTDVLVNAATGAITVFESPRVETRHTHGTGCTLATAIAVGLAQGMALEPAIERARDYVQAAIRAAPGFGHGQGPLNHMHAIPLQKK